MDCFLKSETELETIEAIEAVGAIGAVDELELNVPNVSLLLILVSISSSVLDLDIVKACEANFDWLRGVEDASGFSGVLEIEDCFEDFEDPEGEEDKRRRDIIGVPETFDSCVTALEDEDEDVVG